MILSEVTFNSNAEYKVAYCCHGCGKKIPDNRFEYCPYCGAELAKNGRPGTVTANPDDVCALIAFAIDHGGFDKAWNSYMNDGKSIKYEGPGQMGEVWASWMREKMERAREERGNQTEEGKRDGTDK